jgi:hypothetical protein
VPIVTYRQFVHDGPRASHHAARRQADFDRLIQKHGEVFRAHPRMFAEFLLVHAHALRDLGERRRAYTTAARAVTIHPLHAIRQLAASLVRR